LTPPRPALLTFDVFGTVLDWRRGTLEALARAGSPIDAGRFDGVIDAQGRIEQAEPGTPYREVVARSLVEVAGAPPDAARAIGAAAGEWPLFPDSAAGLRRLSACAPCGATTNSDVAHGEAVQRQLGFRLAHWWCAEGVGRYKPDARVWEHAARDAGVAFGSAWWHVSAYADYDLEVARRLGLTAVLVLRPHHRPGVADLVVPDLAALAGVVDGIA